jgi:hypothetical protein
MESKMWCHEHCCNPDAVKDGRYILEDGREEWWRNGLRHREDRPAMIWPDGRKEWWRNGLHHRENGPAVIYPDGEEWWVNGELHRTDGPAVIWPDGSEEWWVDGIKRDPPTKQDGQQSLKDKILQLAQEAVNEKDYKLAAGLYSLLE